MHFFFREHQLIAVLRSIRDSYASWITRFVSLKVCVGFFIFDSASLFFLKFIFFQQKGWALGIYNVIIPFKIIMVEKLHTILLPNIWFLSCNKKF